jgi:hypothetical protein
MFMKMGEEIQGLTLDVLKLLKILGLDPGLLSTVKTNSDVPFSPVEISQTAGFLQKK